MTADETREGLARALWANDLAKGRVGCEWDDLTDETREWFRDDANAALAYLAALQPTVEQIAAVLREHRHVHGFDWSEEPYSYCACAPTFSNDLLDWPAHVAPLIAALREAR